MLKKSKIIKIFVYPENNVKNFENILFLKYFRKRHKKKRNMENEK